MNTHLYSLLGAIGLTGCALLGCGASDGESSPESASDELRAWPQLSDVAAVEIATVRARTTVLSATTRGAPKKVKSIVTALRKLRPTDPQPRCLDQDTIRLTFLDAASKKIATVDTHCAGFGTLSFADGSTGSPIKFETGVVENVKEAPFAVGDAVWGITKIELSRPRLEQKRVLSSDATKSVLGGYDLDEVPDPRAALPRCIPNYLVAFKRANDEVASTSFLCAVTSGPAPSSVKAHFAAVNTADPKGDPIASGAITLDPRPVMKAFE